MIDQNWVYPSTGGTPDRHQYAYDANSNVLYSDNKVNPVSSELFHTNGRTVALSYNDSNLLHGQQLEDSPGALGFDELSSSLTSMSSVESSLSL